MIFCRDNPPVPKNKFSQGECIDVNEFVYTCNRLQVLVSIVPKLQFLKLVYIPIMIMFTCMCTKFRLVFWNLILVGSTWVGLE